MRTKAALCVIVVVVVSLLAGYCLYRLPFHRGDASRTGSMVITPSTDPLSLSKNELDVSRTADLNVPGLFDLPDPRDRDFQERLERQMKYYTVSLRRARSGLESEEARLRTYALGISVSTDLAIKVDFAKQALEALRIQLSRIYKEDWGSESATVKADCKEVIRAMNAYENYRDRIAQYTERLVELEHLKAGKGNGG